MRKLILIAIAVLGTSFAQGQTFEATDYNLSSGRASITSTKTDSGVKNTMRYAFNGKLVSVNITTVEDPIYNAIHDWNNIIESGGRTYGRKVLNPNFSVKRGRGNNFITLEIGAKDEVTKFKRVDGERKSFVKTIIYNTHIHLFSKDIKELLSILKQL